MRLIRKPATLLSLVVVAIGLATFTLVYSLRGPDPVSRATVEPATPDLTTTPAPGATPDTSRPFWYVPYENAEKQSPKFEGQLGGARILSTPVDFDARALCPSGLSQSPESALVRASEGPTAIWLADRSAGITPLGNPEVWTCGTATVQVLWNLQVSPGVAGVEENGSGLLIMRTLGEDRVVLPGSASRWTSVRLPSGEAAILAPIVEAGGRFIGGCAFVQHNPSTGVLTVIRASAGSPQFCQELGAEVTK